MLILEVFLSDVGPHRYFLGGSDDMCFVFKMGSLSSSIEELSSPFWLSFCTQVYFLYSGEVMTMFAYITLGLAGEQQNTLMLQNYAIVNNSYGKSRQKR